jgi:cell division protein FtsW
MKSETKDFRKSSTFKSLITMLKNSINKVVVQRSAIFKCDHILLLSVIFLCGFGLLIAYSSSIRLAKYHVADPSFNLVRQGLFTLIGFILMLVIKNTPSYYFKKSINILMLINLFFMILALIPGIGHIIYGPSIGFNFYGYNFRPSELLKLSLAFYMAYSISKKGQDMALSWKVLSPHLVTAGIFIILLLFQSPLGTVIIIGFWLLIILCIAGFKRRYILSMLVLGVMGFGYVVLNHEYRVRRIMYFFFPWPERILAPPYIDYFFGGGIFGTGIGKSELVDFYFTNAYAEYELSTLAEETGMVGIACLFILFCVFIWRGIQISLNTRDLYKRYLALGIVIMIGLQAIINVCVTMAIIPNMGLPFPFISYGGSYLVFTLIGAGVLLNISQEEE